MKKFVLAALSLMLTTALILAGSGTLVKFDGDKKELTVKDGDKETTYKLTDKTTFKAGDKDATLEQATKVLSNAKAAGKMKLEFTDDGKGNLTEVKLPMGKKTKNPNP